MWFWVSWVRAPHRTPNWKENDFDVVLFLFSPMRRAALFALASSFLAVVAFAAGNAFSFFCVVVLVAGNALLISGFVAFGTGEGLLWYGICVPCSKQASWGTRRIFRGIRCKKQSSTVRKRY